MEKRLLPIGTKVFDVRYGWGEIFEHSVGSIYELIVDFKRPNGTYQNYNCDGMYSVLHKNPILSITEYTLEKGGFTPITDFDFDAPKVGDLGYFWYEEGSSLLLYGKLKSIQENLTYKYVSEVGCYANFSKEIPEWFKDKMN